MRVTRLEKMAVVLALPLLALGLTCLGAGSDGVALTTAECHALVGGGAGGGGGGTTPGACCNSTTGAACNDNVLCLDMCYACDGGTLRPCRNNGTRCNSGVCDNGIGGCANHQCPRNELC